MLVWLRTSKRCWLRHVRTYSEEQLPAAKEQASGEQASSSQHPSCSRPRPLWQLPPLSRELAGSTERLVMLPNPIDMLVRRAFLFTQITRRFVSVSSPATPLLPFVSSTWSCAAGQQAGVLSQGHA